MTTTSLAVQEEWASASGTSLSVVLNDTPTEGNFLVCRFAGLVSSANLTGPSGWTLAVKRQANTSHSVGIWYKQAGAGESATVTCLQGGASAPLHAQVHEYPGSLIDLANPLDETASNSTTSSVTSLSTGTTAATDNQDELAVAAVLHQATTPLHFTGWDGSFQQELSGPVHNAKMHTADRILTGSEAVTTTATWQTAGRAAAVVATFRLTGTPPTTGKQFRRLTSGHVQSTENTTGSFTTPAFTPTAGRLLLVCIGTSHATGADVDTTIAASHGGAITWDKAAAYVGSAGTARRCIIYRAAVASDPGSGSLTITTPSSAYAAFYQVLEVSGVEVGSNGADGIAQYAVGDSGGGGATSNTTTFATTPASDSGTLGFLLHGVEGERHDRESGYHLINEGAPGEKNQEVSVSFKDAPDSSVTWSWASSIHSISIALELAASSGGTAHTQTVTDSMGLVDAAATAQGHGRTVDDPMGLVDTASPVLTSGGTAHTVTVTDGMGLSDTATAVRLHARTIDDSMGLVDTLTRVQAHTVTVTDLIGLTDTAGTAQTHVRTVTDLIGLADDTTRTSSAPTAHTVTITDGMGLSDTLAPSVVRPTYVFRTPTIGIDTVPRGATGRQTALMRHYAGNPRRGVAVIIWPDLTVEERRVLRGDEHLTAAYVFGGGRENVVDDTARSILEANGYTVVTV